MWWIIILLIVIICAIAFCIWGLCLSVKQRNKTKKLQMTADYSFKTQNGSYHFIYIIKGFKTEKGKQINVALQPELGFSDLKTSSTNSCNTIEATLLDKRSAQVEHCLIQTYTNKLSVNYIIDVPDKFIGTDGIVDLDIVISSIWNLGGNTINEELNFNFNK